MLIGGGGGGWGVQIRMKLSEKRTVPHPLGDIR